jgi:hypothetical protein
VFPLRTDDAPVALGQSHPAECVFLTGSEAIGRLGSEPTSGAAPRSGLTAGRGRRQGRLRQLKVLPRLLL